MAVNGIDLIIPTSIAHTSGSASINAGGSVTFSGVASLSLNGVFSSTYDNYIVDMRGVGAATLNVAFRLRLAGSDASGSNYVSQILNVLNTALQASRGTGNSGGFGDLGTLNANGNQAYFYGPSLAQPTAFRLVSVNSRDNARITDQAVTHSLSTAYDGLTIFPTASNMTGLVKVYGLVK